MTTRVPWLIFYGTLTTTVSAVDEDCAWEAFLRQGEGGRPGDRNPVWDGEKWVTYVEWVRTCYGRIMPPVREEVTIRRPRASDRAWIQDSGNPAFLALLDDLVDA